MDTRIAILSDLHGNPLALEAVLEDLQSQGGADQYLILGDLAAIGYDPNGVLERLARLPSTLFIRGNTDRYLVTGERPAPTAEDVRLNPGKLNRFQEIQCSFAWTQGAITAGGWFDWLASLPLEQRLTLPDGTRLLAVHAAPGTDDGLGVRPDMSEIELSSLAEGSQADLILVGHNHWSLDLSANHVRFVNPGSLSNPFAPDLRASYALLIGDTSSYHIEWRRVDYDRQAVIRETQRVHHPAESFIVRYLTGQHQAPWAIKT